MTPPLPWLTPDVTRMLASLSTPAFDADAMTESQRKNLEAMSALCGLALDCIHESARRQSALLAETVEHMIGSARSAGVNGGMEAQRQLFDRSVEVMREIAELIAKANGEAFEIVGARARTCLDDLGCLAGRKANGKGA